MTAMTASSTTRDSTWVWVLTMTFIPSTDERAVIGRVSAAMTARRSAAMVIFVFVRAWKNSMTPWRYSRCPSAILLRRRNWSSRSNSNRCSSSGHMRSVAIRPKTSQVRVAIVQTASSPCRIANSLLQELLGVAAVATGDQAFQPPDLLRHRGQVVAEASAEGADDREGEVGRRGGVQAPALDPPRDRPGLGEGRLEGDGRVERAVHGDHPVGADELVELQVVDVPVRSHLRPVQDDEDVPGVRVHLGHGVAACAVLGGAGMDAEALREHGRRLGVPLRHVDPQDAVVGRRATPAAPR